MGTNKSKRDKQLDAQRRRRQRAGAMPGMLSRAVFTGSIKDVDQQQAMLPAYEAAYTFAAQNPAKASEIARMDEHRDIAPLVLGLANTASMNLPEEQALDVAWVIKTWAILNGITWFHEWPQPIATYSEREIIELIRAEQAAGKLVPVLPDED